MAIVFDYKDIGERYHSLSDGWVPKEPVKDKVALNADYGYFASPDRIQQIVDRIKNKSNGNPWDASIALHKDVFNKYRRYVMAWVSHSNYLDPYIGLILNHAALNDELTYLEQHTITTEEARFRFRLEFVNWIYSQDDPYPQWDANPKYKTFIETIAESISSFSYLIGS